MPARERKDELPQMQVSFIDLICLPLYKMMSETFPWIRPLYNGTLDNRNHWQDLAEKVEMGWAKIVSTHKCLQSWIKAKHIICKYNSAFPLFFSLTWIDHDTIDKPVEEFAGM